MRLLVIGADYSGKQTLVAGLSRWMIDEMKCDLVRWHDHFVPPRLD
eukprot:COSAG04_NODE_7964_length_1041_cov_0.859873_1_plen_45_part_10